MRTYCTNAAKVTVVRRAGFTPTGRQRDFLAKRVCYVLDRTSPADIEACKQHLWASCVPEVETKWEFMLSDSGNWVETRVPTKAINYLTPTEAQGWSPADVRAVSRLLAWFSYDAEDVSDQDREDGAAEAAYVLVDLNTGRSLVIIGR